MPKKSGLTFANDSERFPAWWEQGKSEINNPSFYGTEEDMMKDIANTAEYKTYFL